MTQGGDLIQEQLFAEIRRRNRKRVFAILGVIVAILIAVTITFFVQRSVVENQKIAEMIEVGERLQPKSDWTPIFSPEDPQPNDDIFCNTSCYRYERTWETTTPQDIDQLSSELEIPMGKKYGLDTYRVNDVSGSEGPKNVQLHVTPPDSFNEKWVVGLLIRYS